MESKTAPKIGERRLPSYFARPRQQAAANDRPRPTATDEQLETYRHTAEHPLWRTNHEQLVVHGCLGPVFLEEIAHSHEHLPLSVAEIQERQRLIDLHVEPRVGAAHCIQHPGIV